MAGRLMNACNFPVDEIEMVAFEKVTDMVQSFMFYRWQGRSFTKLLTGVVLMVAPYALEATRGKHAIGYRRPWMMSDSAAEG